MCTNRHGKFDADAIFRLFFFFLSMSPPCINVSKKSQTLLSGQEKTARSTWCVFFVVFLQNRKKKKTVTDEVHWRAGSASQSNFPLHEEQDINKNILSSPLHFPLLLCGGEKRSNVVWLAIVQPLSFFIPGTSFFLSLQWAQCLSLVPSLRDGEERMELGRWAGNHQPDLYCGCATVWDRNTPAGKKDEGWFSS